MSGERPALPDDWQEIRGAEGERLLVPNLVTRRRQALVVAIITGAVWAGVVMLVRASVINSNAWAVTLMLTALGVWLAYINH